MKQSKTYAELWVQKVILTNQLSLKADWPSLLWASCRLVTFSPHGGALALCQQVITRFKVPDHDKGLSRVQAQVIIYSYDLSTTSFIHTQFISIFHYYWISTDQWYQQLTGVCFALSFYHLSNNMDETPLPLWFSVDALVLDLFSLSASAGCLLWVSNLQACVQSIGLNHYLFWCIWRYLWCNVKAYIEIYSRPNLPLSIGSWLLCHNATHKEHWGAAHIWRQM